MVSPLSNIEEKCVLTSSTAENYYTADYPDDEVDSDDEYGRDPYQYRDGNASDLEEFDDDDEGDAYVVDNGDEPSQFSKFIASREL